jgi:hypothetical protein
VATIFEYQARRTLVKLSRSRHERASALREDCFEGAKRSLRGREGDRMYDTGVVWTGFGGDVDSKERFRRRSKRSVWRFGRGRYAGTHASRAR